MPPHKCLRSKTLKSTEFISGDLNSIWGPRTALPSGDELKQKLLELRG